MVCRTEAAVWVALELKEKTVASSACAPENRSPAVAAKAAHLATSIATSSSWRLPARLANSPRKKGAVSMIHMSGMA